MANKKSKPSSKSGLPAGKPVLIALGAAILAVVAAAFWLLSPNDADSPDRAPVADVGTPDQFYMPSEFDPQEGLFLGGEQLAELHPDVMTAVVRAAADSIKIVILAGSSAGQSRIENVLAGGGLQDAPVTIFQLPVMTMWLRDFGPLTVSDAQGQRSLVEFKYRERRGNKLDNGVPAHLAISLDLNLMGSPLLVEGGDFLSNGRGFCLMSTRVVNRNAHYLEMDPEQTMQNVASILGFENLLLVPPLEGESTGHVDMFCTFLEPDLVVVGNYDPDVDWINAPTLDQTVKDLEKVETLAGPMRVERIPMPDHDDGTWRTYTNIVFANGVVLVPIYPDYCPELDEEALAIYRRLLPDRQIVGIDASGLIKMNGALRCITMNLPTGVLSF